MWVSLGLKLFGIGKWLREAATALLGLIGRYPLQAALILSLCLSGWLWRGKTHAIAERDAAKAETKALAAEYTKAQQLAAAAQADADHREYVLKSDLAEKTHALAVQSAADTRDAVRRYADAHPVRLRCQAAGGSAGGTSGINLPSDPRQPVDPDPTTDMVAVSRADLDTLSGKAVQDSVKAEFLNALVAAGLAVPQSKVPEVGFGSAQDH